MEETDNDKRTKLLQCGVITAVKVYGGGPRREITVPINYRQNNFSQVIHGCQDIQHNDSQHNDARHNHKNMTFSIATLNVTECINSW